ncbi:sn-glycerol-3-phosphate ABC transporter substrate-binding protein UgpB [Parapusillimonas granuli]|uniref:sn-glycerol-3-phosphate-binding periplasmic protein UgpB n=1 Tax=Parapusillimonas granuli TaxID=380911 RepID=A0A853G1Z6_9BURK|nr:sn-glycerol-3-phosphate ABC transporter substrate-binding protein UgpB [Parapusillimonas granuli]MBB5214234.1 sn-glycerol 3-phosphate transport system substrate-binding protein [Parapusillimonas granuli]MEB2399061.1 sn-glycerol-3-phosphate ABC transporter substrate-binding protein UgpB [Alcaligenaceae bacterium]NYT51338.1 sn-glycerol-3-phosphate ABC transporter substrate-binding protein UgpB [Parapusillimonas granuli]
MQAKLIALSFAGLVAGIGTAHAATDITFWHSMEGALGERVNALVGEFNAGQSDYVVKAVYKGAYGESMNAGIAAFRAGNAPDILQVFEVGTATMMYAKGAVQPVQEMSEKAGDPIRASDFLGAVAGYYSSPDGKLVSMPFNSSTPVFYYNKDAFKKAGLDPDHPPKTWPEVHEAGKKLRAAGMECGYTTGWPAWIQLETFAAWHNVPYASQDNGFGGLNARLKLEDPVFAKHLGYLAMMAKEGTFTYGGRGDAPNALFTSGKCGMFTGSSGSRANILKTGAFELGISSLPYHADVPGAPQNTIIGGASLWVFARKSPEVQKGVTKFFKFISSPEKAAQWHQQTGYVPVTKEGYELTRKSGFYDKNPGTIIAVQQLDAATTENSRGIRLGFLPQIREIEDGEMEKIFSGQLTAEAGLANMARRGNELLERFEKSAR